MTPGERLDALEERIEASVGAYQTSLRRLQMRHRVEVGQLLHEINEGGLWQLQGYEKFGLYVKGRWGWDRSYGYRLIDLALVRWALTPLGAAVVDSVVESHARELAPIVKVHGDQATRDFVEVLQLESGGKKVTASAYATRRDKERLVPGPADQSPIGDCDEVAGEVVEAELVDDEAAEQVNQEIRGAAASAEKALRQLDDALRLEVAPFHSEDAARDLSRVRSAAVRLQRRANVLPGVAGA